MSYTAQQLADLKAAVARGVRTVTTDGNTVTYASTAEMLSLIAIIERSLAPKSSRVTHFNPSYDKGV